MTQALRVVLDTNVLVSALVFRQGAMATLRETWQDQCFTPLVSRVTATELIRVLAYPKFRLTRIEQDDLLADYLPYCEVVPMPPELPAVLDCRDPLDVPFLQLAMVGQADYLVTGDRDLLSLQATFAIPIMNMVDDQPKRPTQPRQGGQWLLWGEGAIAPMQPVELSQFAGKIRTQLGSKSLTVDRI